MGMLDGKVAIVTGGGRGIGRAHCLELARHGAAVVVNDPGSGVHGDRTAEDPAAEVVAEVVAAGGRAVADRGSVTSWTDCAALVAHAVDAFGRLDVVVNNAGIVRDRMITSMDESDWDLVVAVHLKGTFAMTKHACDHWRSVAKLGSPVSGRIVNTVSGAGLHGNIGQASYSASKAGIVGLTLVTALEMARYTVTANAISPVAITRLSQTAVGGAAARGDAYDARHPRASSPLVAYLASDAAAWLSGQVLRVEGNTVVRMEGWHSGPRYRTGETRWLEAEELVPAMRKLYGAMPSGIDVHSMLGSQSDPQT